MSPRNIVHRRTQAAKARFADVATTPEGDLRVERLAAVVAVVAVVGGVILYRRMRHADAVQRRDGSSSRLLWCAIRDSNPEPAD